MQIVISAPSGAGKTTLIKELLLSDNRLEFSVSTTTREKRKKEVSHKSYNFVQIDEFKEMIKNDEFIEWAIVHENYYGTTKKEIDRITDAENIPIFDVDVQGGKLLKKKLDDAAFIFIMPPSIEVLKKRLQKRKTESKEQIKIRLQNALSELKEYHIYNYIVINDELNFAVDQLKSIITAELCKKERTKIDINNSEALNANST